MRFFSEGRNRSHLKTVPSNLPCGFASHTVALICTWPTLYTGLIFHTYAPHNAPTFLLISSAIMVAIVGQGTTRCFVALNAQQKNLRQQRGGSNASCYGQKEKALEGGNRDEAGASK